MKSDNDIRKEFQSKFSDYEAPVPSDIWESLEHSLDKIESKTARTLRRRWYVGSVAAVLVFLIGSILFMWNPEEKTGNIISQSAPQTPLMKQDAKRAVEGLPDAEVTSTSKNEESPHMSSPQNAVMSTGNESQPLFAENRVVDQRVVGSEVITPPSPQTLLSKWMKREQPASHASRVSHGSIKGIVAHPVAEIAENIDYDRADEGQKRPLLLAVNGKGGMSGYQQTVNTPMTLRSAAVFSDNFLDQEGNKLNAYPIVLKDNVSEMEHDQPISFGITVSKYLTDDLSIETGLVYSFLRSKTRNSNANFEVQEVQKLHYLGIPVNVNYNLFTLNRLNVYASLGGMVEKDIYGEFRSNREGQAIEINSSKEVSGAKEVTKISQDHPQISLNVGVGASYPLYDRLRLYGKIGGAYYFDANNQYKTIYSDRKIMLDLNVGLRYEF